MPEARHRTPPGRAASRRTPDHADRAAGSGSGPRNEKAKRASGKFESRKGSRTALCLWLPTFELRLELVRSPELDSTSVALLSRGEGRREIRQASERAALAGVRPGMLVSQAVGLCNSLTLLEPDPVHYDAAMAALLEALGEFSPVIEASGRGRVFVGMDGMERLYGSPSRQVERAFQALFRIFPSPLVASFRAGLAPGTFGAWVAAASAPPGEPVLVPEEELIDFLARHPVSSLPLSPATTERLERLGISTLGELVRLPEPALVGQFGDEGRKALAWATGRRIDRVRPRHRPRPIRTSLDFPSPVGREETLHGALDRLVERALASPARRGRSIRGVRLRARLEGEGSWDVETILREPSARRDRIVFPVRSKMSLSPPPRAVESLTVEFFDFGAPSFQTGLFDRREEAGRSGGGWELRDGDVPPSLREAVRELKMKMGHSPLYRVVEVDPFSRIPERRHALLNFDP